jgi:RNA polymerase sigma factor (sigma-70 family)
MCAVKSWATSRHFKSAKSMVRRDHFPDLIAQYAKDLRGYALLTHPQELWLGIALAAANMADDALRARVPKSAQDFEYLFISIFNKIRDAANDIQSSTTYLGVAQSSFMAELGTVASEMIRFRTTTFAPKEISLVTLLESVPARVRDRVFDVLCLLWLLPSTVLDCYVNELADYRALPPIARALKVLNPLESLHDLQAVRTRAERAREVLITCNLKYVQWVAYKFKNSGLDYVDVIQAGNIGLMRAIDKFDVRRMTRLKTFALWWIRQGIMRAIADESRVIRLPVHVSDSLQQMKRGYKNYRLAHVQEPSIDELAFATGLSLQSVALLLKAAPPPIPIEVLRECESCLLQFIDLGSQSTLNSFEHCGECEFRELQPSYGLLIDRELAPCLDRSLSAGIWEAPDAEGFLERVFSDQKDRDRLDGPSFAQVKEHIDSALAKLGARQRKVLELRYGFGEAEPHTLQEVADKMGVTRERIRQIESECLDKVTDELKLHRRLAGARDFAY